MFSGLCREHTRATLDTIGFTPILSNRGEKVAVNLHFVFLLLDLAVIWQNATDASAYGFAVNRDLEKWNVGAMQSQNTFT